MATTLGGLEPVLEAELKQLGARNIRVAKRAITFEGDLGFVYKCNIKLRTALRVLVVIAKGEVLTAKDLQRLSFQVKWGEFFNIDQTFAVDAVVVDHEAFNNSLFAAQCVKDGVVDRFKSEVYKRPNVATHQPDFRIHALVNKDRAQLALDSSGVSLHQRGYRTEVGQAPLSEVLAAGLLLLAGYRGDQPLVDLMTGSGTFLTEAAMISLNLPPNVHREHFAFMNWKGFDGELFGKIGESLVSRVHQSTPPILGFDRDASMMRKARANVKSAELEDFIRIDQRDVLRDPPEVPERALLVMNPPYGEKIQKSNGLYADIGSTLKFSFQGHTAWVFTGDMEGVKEIGLRPSKKFQLLNGNLPCVWNKYEMYAGSKKASKQ